MNVLGLLSYGTNPCACLLQDGKLIFMAEEERFCRIKNAPRRRPISAIKAALEYSKLELSDIDVIAIGWDNSKYPKEMTDFYNTQMNTKQDVVGETIKMLHTLEYNPEYEIKMLQYDFKRSGISGRLPEVRFYPHHLSHAASAYFVSGFDEALVFSIDGSGEQITTAVYMAYKDELIELESYVQPNSLGWFYAAFTEFLGFKAYDGEGKLMGLAPYGSENKEIRRKLSKILLWDGDRYYVDPTYIYFGERSYSQRFTDRLVDKFGCPRLAESPISEYHKQLAYEVQKIFEETISSLIAKHIAKTGISNICMTGGVALNCKLNGVISNLPGVKSIFINPASNDAGTALGAGLLCVKESGYSPRKFRLEHPFWGPEFSDGEIERILKGYKLNYKYSDNIERYAAEKIMEGKIIGWFQGRLEIGARALGNRSILANPTIKDMKDRVNRDVKRREAFRPFAPSILEEFQDQYLQKNISSPFMIIADYVKPEKRQEIPAVVHEDGSVRHQTVSKTTNPKYWNLINEFYKLTGVPLVLNTSLNVRGEPIALSPQDAIRCFYSSGLDVLVLGGFYLEKEGL